MSFTWRETWLIGICAALGTLWGALTVAVYHLTHSPQDWIFWAIIFLGAFGVGLIFRTMWIRFDDEKQRIEELAKQSRREEGAYSPHELN